LRILHIFSGDLWAGAEVMIYNLLRELHNGRGLQVIAISLNEGILTERLRAAGIEVEVLPEAELSFPEIFVKALRFSRQYQVQLIHAHRCKENILALLLAKSLGLKLLITTLHGLPEHSYGKGRGRRRRLWGTIHFHLLRRYFVKTVAVSREIETRLQHEFGFKSGRTAVVHNGIDPGRFVPAEKEIGRTGGFHVGSVGRLVPVKDYDFFLEVAAELKRSLPEVRFSILGAGPLQEELWSKARARGLQDHLVFVPPVADPAAFYRDLDLYLNTSRHEGIPLSILEAMLCGVPVVAPRVGGIPEIIADGSEGVLVGDREPQAFAAACLELLSNRDLREEIARRGGERVAEIFNVQLMGLKYYNLYQETAQIGTAGSGAGFSPSVNCL
jgi:L-malate glycosyltransferase